VEVDCCCAGAAEKPLLAGARYPLSQVASVEEVSSPLHHNFGRCQTACSKAIAAVGAHLLPHSTENMRMSEVALMPVTQIFAICHHTLPGGGCLLGGGV
jgi:hypothetical protein